MLVAGSFVSILSIAAALSQAPARANATGAPRKVTPSPSPSSILEGSVVGPDSKPIKDALVVAEGTSSTALPQATRTDAEGRFRFAEIRGQEFMVGVDADGFAAAVLERVDRRAPIRVRLEKGGAIDGTVRDGSGGGIAAGARIEARSTRAAMFTSTAAPQFGMRTAIADARGNYKVAGLGPGGYRVTAWLRGTGYAVQDDVVAGGRADLVLLPRAALLGMVADDAGRPVEGATIEFQAAFPSWQLRQPRLVSANDGTFIARNVAPAQYTLVVRKTGRALTLAEVTVSGNEETSIDIRMARGTTVTGRLVGEKGVPVAGLVMVVEVDGAALSNSYRWSVPDAETSASGTFVLDGAPAGASVLEIKAPGYGNKRIEVTGDARTRRVDLGDITLETGLAIRGRVRSGKLGVAGAEVTAFHEGPGAGGVQSTVAEADGGFTLGGCEPGKYRMWVDADGYARGTMNAEAGAENVDIVVEPAGSITGLVADRGGAAITAYNATASARARDSDEPVIRQDDSPDPEGRFLIERLAAGTYSVAVDARGFARGIVKEVKVAAGRTTDAGRIRLGPGGRVSGTVTSMTGEPLPGATVAVLTEGDDYLAGDGPSAAADVAGAFELRGLENGPTMLVARHPDYRSGKTSIEIDAARSVTDARLVLTPGGRIAGMVRRRDGMPPVGMFVRVDGAAQDDSYTGRLMTQVSNDGSFTIEHAAPGNARLKLLSGSRGAYSSGQEKDVEVRDGETSTVEFLLRDILVSGTVTHQGAPAAGYRLQFTGHGAGYSMVFAGATAAAGPQRYMARTREDGSYEAILDEPGSYGVMIFGTDSRMVPEKKAEIPDADTFVFDIALTGATIHGTVTDKETGAPLGKASVQAMPDDSKGQAGYGSSLQTGADGRFQIDLNPGRYMLSASHELYTADPVPLNVAESGNADVEIAMTKGLRISGRVVNASGMGVPGLDLTATGPDRSAKYGQSLIDGSFVIGGLKAGAYNIAAQARAGGAYGLQARVAAGAEDVTIGPTPRGRIAVLVAAADGSPASHAAIYWAKWQGESFEVWGQEVSTDATGRGEIEVPAGQVELNVFKDQGGSATVLIEVPPGGTAAATVRLAAPEQSQ